MSKIIVRKATIKDTAGILALVNFYAQKELMLPRGEDAVIQNLRDFFVAVEMPGKKIIGCAALHLYTDRLSEIKSLAVAEEHVRRGFGAKLVKRCLAEAKALGLPKVFALTYAPEFFAKNKFKPSVKELLPQKIWEECRPCPRRDNCAEKCFVYDI
ncbi:acetyltransferase GNAT family protein [Candidatus Termititenax aidoneus]|uniref:Acetyltransferase GNAT family protein n=1 Tax=Termititenax aidoneus TaxID=2218524 RepID=A0A388TCN2_TERA1|nr:acetyltransferase GNAT family protein [Candidatus Termititenax aidoneus]